MNKSKDFNSNQYKNSFPFDKAWSRMFLHFVRNVSKQLMSAKVFMFSFMHFYLGSCCIVCIFGRFLREFFEHLQQLMLSRSLLMLLRRMSPLLQRFLLQTPWLLVLVSMTTKLNYKLTHLLQAWVEDGGEKICWSENPFRASSTLQKQNLLIDASRDV